MTEFVSRVGGTLFLQYNFHFLHSGMYTFLSGGHHSQEWNFIYFLHQKRPFRNNLLAFFVSRKQQTIVVLLLYELSMKISWYISATLWLYTLHYIWLYYILCIQGMSTYYVSSYNKAGSVRMLTNAYLREQGFIKKLMSYENQH